MQFPYKIYQARNPSVPAYVFVGKAAIAGYYGSKTSFFPHQVRKDCQDIFLFATIIGGKNIKITAATEADPYIYIDTRWTTFSTSAETSSSFSFLKEVVKDTNFTLTASFRSLNSDGSLLIKTGANSKFFWNGVENVIDPDLTTQTNCITDDVTNEDGQIIIKRYDYSLVDNPITKLFWEKRAVSLIDKKIVDQDNYKVTMQLKSIVGSECITVEDTPRKTIKISFNKLLCPCGCFDFISSSSSSSSSIEICAGLESICTSSSSSSSNSSSSNSSSSSSSNSSSSSHSTSSSSSNSSSSPSSFSTSSSSSKSSSSSSFDERCEPRLMTTVGVENSMFGGSVATTDFGEYVAVGAPSEKAVYIFQTPTTIPTGLPGYTQLCKISHADIDFGWSVDFSADGEWLIVGAPGYNDDQGRVHLFSKTRIGSWASATTPSFSLIGTGTATKASTPNKVGHRFGHSVCINALANSSLGNILVGCPYFTQNPNIYGINSGSAFSYNYVGVNWANESVIIPADAEQQDFFGWDVALTQDGADCIVSSVHSSAKGIQSGCAYEFNYSSGWNLIRKLTASDGQPGDKFGTSVSIGRDTELFAIVGSPQHNNDNGAVYIYMDATEHKLIPADVLAFERFGFDVSVNGDSNTLVVSSVPRNYLTEPYSGVCRVYKRKGNNWSDLPPDNKLFFSGLTNDDGFGYTVDIANNASHIGVSAPYYENKKGYTQLISLEADCYNFLGTIGIGSSSSSSSSSTSSTSSASSNSSDSSSSPSSTSSDSSSLSVAPSSSISSPSSASNESTSSSSSSSSDAFVGYSLYTWGYNYFGQLGINTTDTGNTPALVDTDYAVIAAGGSHVAAIKTNGDLYAWGYNSDGELGDNTTDEKHLPTFIGSGYSKVAAGGSHTVALKSNGDLYAWGYNFYGQLGDNTIISKYVPTFIEAGYSQIAAGNTFTLALKSNGDLYAWGNNQYGQLGFGPPNRHSPTFVGSGYSKISAGGYFSAAIKTNGDLYMSGSNFSGQLGDGTTDTNYSFKLIGSGYSKVSAGGNHTVAIKTNGDLYAWGGNGSGKLGDNTTDDKYVPTFIGSGYSEAWAGGSHTVAIKTNGNLYAWGDNYYGEIGDNTYDEKHIPTLIGSGYIKAQAGSFLTVTLRQ